jgi:CheY-like chemotaxis protein
MIVLAVPILHHLSWGLMFNFNRSRKSESVTTETREVSDAKPLSAPCALLVDDDESMLELMQLAFENAGFKVVTARNGSAAIDRLKSTANVSVILLDVQMPIMNGNEVLDEMRLAGYLDQIPVLILSAHGHVNEYNEVCKIMTKPVTMEYLITSVQESIAEFARNSRDQ